MTKLIIAHRGASREAPENTLEAFERAVEIGADMIELDVRETSDNVLVVIHGPQIYGIKIQDSVFQHLRHMYPKVPTLLEVLSQLKGKIKFDVEIKERGCEKETIGLLLKYLPLQDFIVTSSLKGVLRAVKDHNPLIKTGWIIGNKRWVTVRNILSLARNKILPEADMLVMNWMLYIGRLKKFARTKELLIFTADRERVISRLLKDDCVSGIITNDPRLGVKLRG